MSRCHRLINTPPKAAAPGDLWVSQARVQALEREVQSLRSAIAQHISTCGGHASYRSATQHLPNSTQAIEALRIDASPDTIDGFNTGLPLDQSNLQNGLAPGFGYGASPIASLQYNSPVNASGPSFPSVVVDYPNIDFSNLDANAGQHPDEFLVTTQDDTASHIISASGYNGYNRYNHGMHMDMFDFTPASARSETVADAGYNMPDENQCNVDRSAIVTTQDGTTSQSIGNFEYNGYNADLMGGMFAAPSMFSTPGGNAGYSMSDVNQGNVDRSIMAPTSINTVSTSSATAAAPAGHYCRISRNCHHAFTRRTDRDRHERTHGPPQFSCGFAGCHAVFSRRDKFNDHRARRSH
ncbi:hypothetical protein DL95DRAFT_389628 [Leptodontidium sp. 2 PMI_412]|nr:hypothetical protein DL95DRAFT_389628 [Leptodontidium sp. 2 PMI_412]